MAQTPKTTYNTDVHSFVRRCNRFIVELMKSQSSGVSQTMPFDVSRVLSYLTNLRAYLAWVTGQPLLDLPETGPMEINLPDSPSIQEIENESVYDLCLLIEVLRDEIANSQSSRLATNLISYDYKRATDIIMKIETFIKTFIAVVEPLDLPESSPMHDVSGAGRQGV